MRDPLAAMKTALRVLSAITENHKPEAVDLEELRQFAPSLRDAPMDELACDVIQQALKIRELQRARNAAGIRADRSAMDR